MKILDFLKLTIFIFFSKGNWILVIQIDFKIRFRITIPIFYWSENETISNPNCFVNIKDTSLCTKSKLPHTVFFRIHDRTNFQSHIRIFIISAFRIIFTWLLIFILKKITLVTIVNFGDLNNEWKLNFLREAIVLCSCKEYRKSETTTTFVDNIDELSQSVHTIRQWSFHPSERYHRAFPFLYSWSITLHLWLILICIHSSGFNLTSSSSSFSFSMAVSDSASAKLSTAIAKKTFNRISGAKVKEGVFFTRIEERQSVWIRTSTLCGRTVCSSLP